MPPAPFPPGDAICARRLTPSRWRTFRFAFNQVARTVEPHLPLSEMIRDWNKISRQLSEPPRKRVPQMHRYFPEKTS